ncbi:DUF3574 domain-containing protein [Fredinandcohnia onubensis]|uniref:DUF3574 domain-containing protein n=1 Tax=Fredinandcohnia onubensis TaxID=1571209 RepID=UPI0011563203|nr:DUF3574 domain-containing protein [Fredinandcohnia onubensis]
MNEKIYEYEEIYEELTEAEMQEFLEELKTRFPNGFTTEQFIEFIDWLDEKGLVLDKKY